MEDNNCNIVQQPWPSMVVSFVPPTCLWFHEQGADPAWGLKPPYPPKLHGVNREGERGREKKRKRKNGGIE